MAGGKNSLLPPDGDLVTQNGGRASSPGWTGGTPVLHQKQKASPQGDEAFLKSKSYTLNDDPQPQVLFTFGFSNLKPAPSRVST